MWRNNIIQTSSSEDQIGKKESNNQNSHIHHDDDPTGQITKIMNIKSQISSRKIFWNKPIWIRIIIAIQLI